MIWPDVYDPKYAKQQKRRVKQAVGEGLRTIQLVSVACCIKVIFPQVQAPHGR